MVLSKYNNGFIGLIYGVNLKYNRITFSPNFVTDLQSFEKENNRLKLAIMQAEKYKRVKDQAVGKDERLKGRKKPILFNN